jgi:hypothetical protein
MVVTILIQERKFSFTLEVPFKISGLFLGKMKLYLENKNIAEYSDVAHIRVLLPGVNIDVDVRLLV